LGRPGFEPETDGL